MKKLLLYFLPLVLFAGTGSGPISPVIWGPAHATLLQPQLCLQDGVTCFSTGGGGGSPGGSNGQLQFNNSGAFGGFGSWNGSLMTVPQATISSQLNTPLISGSNGGNTFVDMVFDQIYDETSGNLSIDWNARKLYKSDGATVALDWSTTGPFVLPSLTAGSALYSDGTTIAQDNANYFYDPTLHFLGLKLNGTAPQGVIDAGLAATQTVTGVSSGSGALNNLTSANSPPSGLSASEDTGGSGYTANGTTYCYDVYTYTTLNSVNFGSGPSNSCFGDSNDGAPFASQLNWSAGGGTTAQVVIQGSPSNIPESVAFNATSFTDSNNMVANSAAPLPVTSYAYNANGSALNIVYNVYSYKLFSGTKTYTATPYAITITDPNDGGWYIPFIQWTAVAGVNGYKVIRDSDNQAIDIPSGNSFYDSSAFVSWTGNNTVTPNTYVPPSIRTAGDVLQSGGNWAIHSDGTFSFFSNTVHLDNNGELFAGGISASGLSVSGPLNLSGTLNGGNVSLGAGTFSTTGQMNIGGLSLYTGGADMQFDVFGTGTKLGTATNQMFAFYGGTPHVQQTGNIITALGSSGANLIASPVLPNPGASSLGGVISKPTNANQWLDGISSAGIVTASQPAFTNISGTLPTSQLSNAGAAFMQGFSGVLASVTSNAIIGYGLVPRAITLQNIVAINNGTLVCTVNPTVTLQDCGTSVSSCTSGITNKAAVTVSSSNTGLNGSIINAGIAAGHYWAFQLTGGTCTAANINVSAEYVMQ